MPSPSRQISTISTSDLEGWEVYIEAVNRQQAGQEITMLAIGDHDFSTPYPIVEACKKALDDGHHNYANIKGQPELCAAMARISTHMTGIETSADEVIAVPGGTSRALWGLQGGGRSGRSCAGDQSPLCHLSGHHPLRRRHILIGGLH